MNLKNLNLIELDAQEMQNVDGGGLIELFRGAAYAAQLVAEGVALLEEKCAATPGCSCQGNTPGRNGQQNFVNGSGGNKW